MTAYILVVAMLSVLAFWESGSSSKNPGKLACFALIIFGGLRHETGFDWMEYETYFELTKPIWSNTPQYIEPNLLVEPGFALFNVIIRSLALPFQALLLIIAVFNMVTIYVFSSRYTNKIALVFLVYFGFVFLAGQMAAIRQTFSFSFILWAFIEKDKGNIKKTLVLLAIAVSIHTFSIIFLPLPFIRTKTIPLPVVSLVVGFGVVAAYSGFQIVPLAADYFLPILGAGFLATKLSLYGDYEGYAISTVSMLFIPLHLTAYFLLTTNKFKFAEEKTNLTHLAISATLLSLITHSYFGVFPAFWNRIGYLTLLLQPVALTARYRAYFRDPTVPVVSIALATAAGASVVVYALSSPTSLPYVPYQNVAVAWMTGDHGDGRERYLYAFQEAEREIASRRR